MKKELYNLRDDFDHRVRFWERVGRTYEHKIGLTRLYLQTLEGSHGSVIARYSPLDETFKGLYELWDR